MLNDCHVFNPHLPFVFPASENTNKRKYKGGGNRSAPELSCALCEYKLIKLNEDITAHKSLPEYSGSGQNLSLRVL